MLEKIGAFEVNLLRQIPLKRQGLIVGEFIDPIVGFGYARRRLKLRTVHLPFGAPMLLQDATKSFLFRLTGKAGLLGVI
ncbi:MAG: hypothetical protein JJ922_02050 [Parvibaculum sp.]|nr:hypothetical protein [Parvibaculum sp.]